MGIKQEGERTWRARVRVPSTSKRQIVFFKGRASRGVIRLATSVMIEEFVLRKSDSCRDL